ncbi:MAG: TonB-dependent receptor [Gammaproteobacteria bacterium]|nr:TonB-dependent receptor [Gammaproteobacteria bacterium]
MFNRLSDPARPRVGRALARRTSRTFARKTSLAVAIASAATLANAQQNPEQDRQQDGGAPGRTEQLVVLGERVYPVVDTVAPSTQEAVDTAELLKQLPGSNLNANGLLTGIAQYRGLYGDRVAVSIDGLRTLSGGPNGMDAPLSYASPLLLEHLSLERGIASVSSATESIGGHMSVDYDRGRHADTSAFEVAGKAQGRYASNGSLSSTAARVVAANDTHKLAFLGQVDSAGDADFPGGTLRPTRLDRERYDLSYSHRGDNVETLVFAGRLDTTDTGTPSLPMDIDSIETDLAGVRVDADLGTTSLDLALGYSDVAHAMDNYSLRTPPATPLGYRETLAVADGVNFRLGAVTRLGGGEWRYGVDGQTADHTATITNPNAAAFRIDNFNRVERDVFGAYGQWNRSQGRFDYEAGIRVNRMRASSGVVSASIPAMNPMMQMMGMNAALLAARFNESDLCRSLTNVDAVLKVGRVLGDMRSVYVEVARKTRAPSYQELYLWLPLESTGGLADGRSYVGNPALVSEVSREINIGSNWSWNKAWFAPQIFYKDITNYIQGVPTADATANAVAMMMTGAAALEFANTDAKIYGLDAAWGVYLTESLVLDGVVTWVRGRRTDVADNLYRLAPPNGRIGLKYEAQNWTAGVDALVYARQEDVASYNGERPTPGYGIVNAAAQWQIRPSLRLSATVANLFDKQYRDHVDGINRVMMADVPVGERLYGLGRSFNVGVEFAW